MTTRISLSEPLADLCDRSCARCAREVAGNACACAPPAPSQPSPSVGGGQGGGPPPEIRKRWFNLPKPRCERCEFLLLIQAIEHLVPAEAQPDWLGQPNVDLGGQSPKACIDAGAYEAVFTTLCLLDPLGPVS